MVPQQQQQPQAETNGGRTALVGDLDPSSSIPLNASDDASFRTGMAENQEVPDTGSLDSASVVHNDETERTGEAVQIREEVAFAPAVGVEPFNTAAGENPADREWLDHLEDGLCPIRPQPGTVVPSELPYLNSENLPSLDGLQAWGRDLSSSIAAIGEDPPPGRT